MNEEKESQFWADQIVQQVIKRVEEEPQLQEIVKDNICNCKG